MRKGHRSYGSGTPTSSSPDNNKWMADPSTEEQESEADFFRQSLVRTARAVLEREDLDATLAYQVFEPLVPLLLWDDDEATLEELLLLLETKHSRASATLQYQIAEWRAEAALSTASDARPAGLRTIAENPLEHPFGFRQLLDRLHYHGAVSTLLELMPLALEATSQLPDAGLTWHLTLQREFSFLRWVDATARGEELESAELQPPADWWWGAVRQFFFEGARGDWTPKSLTGVFPPVELASRLGLASLEFAHDLVEAGHNPAAAELARRSLFDLLRWQLNRKMQRTGRRTRGGKKLSDVNLQPKSLLLDARIVEDFLGVITQDLVPSLYAAAALVSVANPWNQFLAARSLVSLEAAATRHDDLVKVQAHLMEYLLHRKCDRVLLNELVGHDHLCDDPNCGDVH